MTLFSLRLSVCSMLGASDPRGLEAEDWPLIPNGVDLSPDERTLYGISYMLGLVQRYDVAPDGALSHGTTLIAGLTNPDSMCVDVLGNLYIGTRQGIAVLAPDGTWLWTIPLLTLQGVTNCAFGGTTARHCT